MEKYASNTAATRIEPRKCASFTRVLIASELGGTPSAERSPRFMPDASPNCCASSMSGLRMAICAVRTAWRSSPDCRVVPAAGARPRGRLRRRRAAGGRHGGSELKIVQSPAGLLDRVEKGFLVREVAEQRCEVGESLVKGQHVGIGRLREIGAHAVENRVRYLVG